MPLRSNPKSAVLWGLIIGQLVGALQQHPYNAYPSKGGSDELPDGVAAMERRWASQHVADSLPTPLSGQRGFRDTYVEKPHASHASHNEGALATLSPAEDRLPAVRAPPGPRSSAATAGLSSRQPARSLQDWQVEDIILLATVDGKIHARDRKTGAARWHLETTRPMVETTYHPRDKTAEDSDLAQEDPLWIVEPSQDGSIYIYLPESGLGMQKLDYTVKELVDLSPYASQTDPQVTYTSEKRTTIYTVDAGTGNILKGFNAAGAFSNDDRSCRQVNPLESVDECKSNGTITLGRTEYTVGISQGSRQITTIHYSEWGPNSRDSDLRSKYVSTMDKKYVYTKHDGSILGLDFTTASKYGSISSDKPSYRQTLSTSPVVRVFDIVRPQDDQSSDAALVILPQPVAPSMNDYPEPYETVFVDCTENGSWYALSEVNYPGVTDGVSLANWYNDDMFKLGLPGMAWPPARPQRAKFTGVHPIAPTERRTEYSIDAPEWPRIDPPSAEHDNTAVVGPKESSWDTTVSLRTVVIATVLTLVLCGVGGAVYGTQLKRPLHNPISEAVPQPPVVEETVAVPAPLSVEEAVPEVQETLVRVIEPAKEIIFPHEEIAAVQEEEVQLPKIDEVLEPASEGEVALEEVKEEAKVEAKEDQDPKDRLEVNEPKKKKGAHRGRRGGKKTKEKEQQQAETRAAKTPPVAVTRPAPAPPVVINLEPDSDSGKVVGPLQINSLMIHTDRVIGQGSCGTSVFEGAFEGRAVAVKRMLSQYYELASQEVSFLQQSDDHPNVIRYFCQQKDDHFLYIAVELCQASLFEVWEAEKGRADEERQKQLLSLKFTIQQDVPKALQQLAAGLYHLHNLRIIHRDIKPQNILVAFPKKNQSNGPRLVISDFGLGKNLPENVSTLVDPTGNAGTSGWKAPELISQPRDTDSRHSQSNSHTGGSENTGGPTSGVKRAADIFSLGCLFFWVLTDGIHPYEDENGWQQLRELNIKRDHKKMGVLERWSDAYEPMQLITSMLAHQPEDRPTALQVLNHPFFWPPAKRLAFLCDCSDHFEREPRGTYEDYYAGDSYHLGLLEDRVEEIMAAPYEQADFLARLDRHFVDTLGKQRKYSGNRVLDLLRALRNKKNHYEDMPEDVKRRVGPLPEGYLNFWSHRFPRLLTACYEVVHLAGLERNDRFRGYFVLGT